MFFILHCIIHLTLYHLIYSNEIFLLVKMSEKVVAGYKYMWCNQEAGERTPPPKAFLSCFNLNLLGLKMGMTNNFTHNAFIEMTLINHDILKWPRLIIYSQVKGTIYMFFILHCIIFFISTLISGCLMQSKHKITTNFHLLALKHSILKDKNSNNLVLKKTTEIFLWELFVLR